MNATAEGNAPARSSRIDAKLRWRLRLLGVIAVVLVAIVAVQVVRGDLAVGWTALAVAGGTAVGVAVNRMQPLAWDANTGTVIARMDAVGTVNLVAYLVFSLTKGRLIEAWSHAGPEAVASSALAVTAGTLCGRVVASVRGIRRLLFASGVDRLVGRGRRNGAAPPSEG